MIARPLAPNDPPVIGRYRVLGLLGSGGMGRVLLAVGPDGRYVALKQIHPHLLDEPEYRARFRREVSASTRVSGAFTAPVIDFDVDGHMPWLASVFVVGVPLDSAVEEHGPLPVPAVLVLAAGLAAALQEIHKSGLVHRDLKPANVLLAADGPRVIDFGIAQLTENPGGLTEAGSTIGSPAYMSPEQALSEPVSYASDIFSLGSLLAMVATGSSPFAAPSLAYTLFNIAHAEPNLERLPPELRGLVAACLHKDPQARPTPVQLLEHIGRLPEQPMPWPGSILGAIDRQAHELAALTTNPDATLVVSRSGSTTAFTPSSTGSLGTSVRGRGTRRAALVAMVVLLLIAGGVAWVRLGNDSSRPEAAVPMLTRLRDADTCAWLRQALDGSVPVETGWPTDMSTWKLSTDWNWGCAVEAAGQQMSIGTGSSVRNFRPAGREIDDLAILGSSRSGYCDRAADVSSTGEQWGLTVKVSGGGQECGLADHVLTRLIATRDQIPERTESASLAAVDPCGLVSWDFMNDTLGPLPKTPAELAAHTCLWQGSSTAMITLRLSNDIPTDRPIELGDGQRLYTAASQATSTVCGLYYPYRKTGDQQEAVKVEVYSANHSYEEHCATAESLMRSLLPNLPKPN